MRQFEIDSDFEIIKYLMLIGGSRLLNGQAEGSETGSLQTSFYDIQGGVFSETNRTVLPLCRAPAIKFVIV